MTSAEFVSSPPEIARLARVSITAGAVALAATILGGLFNPAQFFFSYLVGFLFWTGITLGCMGIAMIHHLSGGNWGVPLRRILEAASRTLPLIALLFIPLALGLPLLYPWARPELVRADELLQRKALYLNVPFFLARAAFYLAIWNAIAFLLCRWSAEQDRTGDPRLERKMQRLSAGGLLLYALTMTFAATDWVMSLEPHWFSTIFGVLLMGGQGLSGLAFSIVAIYWLGRLRGPIGRITTPAIFHDAGNLLLAFVMLWSYFSIAQYLIIWMGNLPEEIPWYLERLHAGWQVIAAGLILFHFALPFLLLLSRRTKRTPHFLVTIAVWMLAMRLIDLFWLVAPNLHTQGLAIHWLDLMAPIGIGGLWLGMFGWRLQSRPLVPVHIEPMTEWRTDIAQR
ncbi:MAG: hypothetical protein HY654_03555 [Acidobacteria bacterium]|nr:hypothetical protein [Acidobacteriota bacterium]